MTGIKNSTLISFIIKGNVIKIEGNNWSIRANCILRGEPTSSSAKILMSFIAVIIFQ